MYRRCPNQSPLSAASRSAGRAHAGSCSSEPRPLGMASSPSLIPAILPCASGSRWDPSGRRWSSVSLRSSPPRCGVVVSVSAAPRGEPARASRSVRGHDGALRLGLIGCGDIATMGRVTRVCRRAAGSGRVSCRPTTPSPPARRPRSSVRRRPRSWIARCSAGRRRASRRTGSRPSMNSSRRPRRR